MNDMKVSIIIPVYNPGKLLIKCLDSVKKQSLKEIECICIDDESSDDSLNILKEYSENDNRFKILTQKHLGAGSARNKGINVAKGEYIIFLDSDDWIEENMCQSLYDRAKKLDVDLLLFDSTRHLENNTLRDLIHFNGNQFNEESIFDYHKIKDKVMNGPYGVIWCKFYKTKFIRTKKIYFPNHIIYNDVEFHIKCMILAEKIAYYPEIFYHYNRIGQISLQNNLVSSSKAMVFYDVMKGIEEFLNETNKMDEFKNEFLSFGFYEFRNKLNSIKQEYKEEYFIVIKKFFESMNIELNDFKELDEEYFIYYSHLMGSETYEEFLLMNQYITQETISPNRKKIRKNQEFLKNIKTMIDCEIIDYKDENEMLKKDYEMLKEVNHHTFRYLLKKMNHNDLHIQQDTIEFKNKEINRLNEEVNELKSKLNNLIENKNKINDSNNKNELLITQKNKDLSNLIIKKDEKINELTNENRYLNEKLKSLKNELKIKEHIINSFNQ